LKQNYNLITLNIQDALSEKEYLSLLTDKFYASAYYSLEHLRYFAYPDCEIRCFLLKKNDKEVIMMPIILRQIIIKDVVYPYFDTISPYGYNGPLSVKSVTDEDYSVFWELKILKVNGQVFHQKLEIIIEKQKNLI